VRGRGGLTPVVIVFVLHNLQTHMMRPYVPLYAASLDYGYIVVGVVAAAVGFLPIFFALPVGSLTDRVGVRPMVAIGAATNAIGFLLLVSFPDLVTVLVTQMLAGFSNLLITLSTQTYIGTLGKGRAAERNFGTFTMFASIGQIGGPLIGGLIIGHLGFSAGFLTAVCLSTLCCATALLLLPRSAPVAAPRSPRAAPRRALQYLGERETQLAILASCLMSIPEILRTSFLPLFLGEVIGVAAANIGYVLAIFSVAGLVAKSVLPRVVGRFGRQLMLLIFVVGCALSLLVLPLTSLLPVVCVIVACMGLTFGLGRPLSMAMAANAARPGEEGFVVALRLSGNRIADFVLPVVFGTAATVAGIGAVFVAGAVLLFGGAGALLRPAIAERRERRSPPPVIADVVDPDA
jgi:MFS family permease